MSIENYLMDKKQYILVHYLQQHLHDTLHLERGGLLNPEHWTKIKSIWDAEQCAQEFTRIFLETFYEAKYEALITALTTTDYSHYVGDEMGVEALAEAETIKPSDRMEDDAKMLVHREFGHSRRHTEQEKKKIHAMVAKIILILYTAAQQYLPRLDDRIAFELKVGLIVDEEMHKLIEELKSHNQLYSSVIQVDEIIEKAQKSVVFDDGREDHVRDAIVVCEAEISELVKQASSTFLDINEELSNLEGVRPQLNEDYRFHVLQDAIKLQMEALERQLADAKNRKEKAIQQIQAYRQEIREFNMRRERDLKNATKRMLVSRSSNNQSLSHMINTSDKHVLLTERLADMPEMIELWKWRVECLEKDKRLLDIYDRENCKNQKNENRRRKLRRSLSQDSTMSLSESSRWSPESTEYSDCSLSSIFNGGMIIYTTPRLTRLSNKMAIATSASATKPRKGSGHDS